MNSVIGIIVQAVYYFADFLYLLIIVRCILSWIPSLYGSSFFKLVYRLTEPIMGPIRRMLDKSPIGGGMGIDFSPIIACFLIMAVQRCAVGVLYSLVL